MKYRLVNPEIKENYAKNLIEFKGISNLEEYMNPSILSLQTPNQLDNIDRGARLFLDILDNNNITYGADKFNQVHFFFNRQQYCIYRSIKLDKNFNCGNPTPLCIKSNDSNLW